MFKYLYKVDKLKEKIDESIKYFSPFGVTWLYIKGLTLITLVNKPFDKMLDMHQNFDNDKQGSVDCSLLCVQRYAPIKLGVYWSFQIFVSMLPMIAFLGYCKQHIVSCSSKTRQKLVKNQIVKVSEDRSIRLVKITTLVFQVGLELISICILIWLQMQKYNLVNFGDLWSRNIFEVLFVIPEIYVCNLAEARDQTYFGQDWKDLHLSACNGGAEKSTYWTSRSIESSFIHSALLMLAILSMIFTYLELIYNICRLIKKPTRKLSKKVSSKIISTLYKRDMEKTLSANQIIANNIVKSEIARSNFNLERVNRSDDNLETP